MIEKRNYFRWGLQADECYLFFYWRVTMTNSTLFFFIFFNNNYSVQSWNYFTILSYKLDVLSRFYIIVSNEIMLPCCRIRLKISISIYIYKNFRYESDANAYKNSSRKIYDWGFLPPLKSQSSTWWKANLYSFFFLFSF